MNLTQAICDEINEHRDGGLYGCVIPCEILCVRVRPGCAQMEVDLCNVDGETVVIDADPVFTALLNQILREETGEGGDHD